MRDYPVRRRLWKGATRERLMQLMEEVFGNAAPEGEWVVSSRYPITEIRAAYVRRDNRVFLRVETRRDQEADDEEFLEAMRDYNRFVELATGYTAKERKKLLMKEAS